MSNPGSACGALPGAPRLLAPEQGAPLLPLLLPLLLSLLLLLPLLLQLLLLLVPPLPLLLPPPLLPALVPSTRVAPAAGAKLEVEMPASASRAVSRPLTLTSSANTSWVRRIRVGMSPLLQAGRQEEDTAWQHCSNQ